jgi:hypothetical protein
MKETPAIADAPSHFAQTLKVLCRLWMPDAPFEAASDGILS